MTTPAVTAALLRDLMRQVTAEMPGAPTQPLRVGEVVAGRVALGPGGEKMLMLAGVKFPATLPGDVPVGVPLRFQVTESGGNALVLKVLPELSGGGAGARAAATGAGPAAAVVGGVAAASGVDSAQGLPGPPNPLAAEAASLGATPWGALPMPGGAQVRMFLDPDVGRDDDAGPAPTGERSRSMVVRYDSPTLGRVDVVLRLDPERLEATVLAPAGEPVARVRAASGALREALQTAADRPVALSTGGRTTEVVDVRV